MESTILKLDVDRQIAYGFASVSTIDGEPLTDRQGDQIDEDELEKMAHNFVRSSRKAGAMHRKVIGEVIESCVFTKEKQDLLGIDLGHVGWWIGMHVTDADTWSRVKSGELSAFSIHGRAIRSEG